VKFPSDEQFTIPWGHESSVVNGSEVTQLMLVGHMIKWRMYNIWISFMLPIFIL